MQPPSKKGKKVYIFGLDHITKIAAMLIHVYGKNIKKSTSPDPLGGLP